jgi:hypothetical protein
MLTLFDWGRVPGSTAQQASWGRYRVFLRPRSTGAWEVVLYHGPKRRRAEELPAELGLAAARAQAEQVLLDEQGPEVRELVRRAQLAQAAGSATRSLRAAGKRRRAPAKRRQARARNLGFELALARELRR